MRSEETVYVFFFDRSQGGKTKTKHLSHELRLETERLPVVSGWLWKNHPCVEKSVLGTGIVLDKLVYTDHLDLDICYCSTLARLNT